MVGIEKYFCFSGNLTILLELASDISQRGARQYIFQAPEKHTFPLAFRSIYGCEGKVESHLWECHWNWLALFIATLPLLSNNLLRCLSDVSAPCANVFGCHSKSFAIYDISQGFGNQDYGKVKCMVYVENIESF